MALTVLTLRNSAKETENSYGIKIILFIFSLIGLVTSQISKHKKNPKPAMCVDISKVLDEHKVDDEVDREHPPVEGVEKPDDPLLLAVGDQELELAGVHAGHGQHEAELGQGPDPQLHLQLCFFYA